MNYRENKSKTNIARYVPISTDLYNAIKKFKTDNKLKDNESILTNDIKAYWNNMPLKIIAEPWIIV